MTTLAANPGFYVLYAMSDPPRSREDIRAFPVIAWFIPGGIDKPIPISAVYGSARDYHAIKTPDGAIIDRHQNSFGSVTHWLESYSREAAE